MSPPRPILCIGKKARLKKTKVSQKCIFPRSEFIILPNIFGYQKVIAPKMANKLPPNRT